MEKSLIVLCKIKFCNSPDGNIATEKYIISQFKKTVKKISDEEIFYII